MNLEIHVTSATADDTLAGLSADFLEVLSAEKPVMSDAPPELADRRALDPVAVAAVVLSVPGAALALTQLVEHVRDGRRRRALGTRIAPLLDYARTPGQRATLLIGNRVVDLTTASSDEVLDALEAAADDIDRTR